MVGPAVAHAKALEKRGLYRRSPTLLGGDGVFVRRVRPEDAGGLRGMFARCSPETIYFRFHLPRPTAPEWAIGLLAGTGDVHRDGRAIVTVDGAEIVGHAMYVREQGDGREAEVAVVVEDGWQSSGVGKLLFSEIAGEARRAGVEVFACTTLGANYRLHAVVRRAFPGSRTSYVGGACSIRVPLAEPRGMLTTEEKASNIGGTTG